MTKMVNYTEPEPEFEAPADISSKEEPVILSEDIRQQEMDEIAERVKAARAGKLFEASPENTPDTPKLPKDETVFEMPPTPPRVDEKQWYKQAHIEHQEIYRQPPEVERRNKQSDKNTSNKRSYAEIDRIIRSGRFYTNEGGKSIKMSNVYMPQPISKDADIVDKPKKKGWFK